MTSHDVRRLHVCSICGDVGIWRPRQATELRVVLEVAADVYTHPTCYVRRRRIRGLLALPEAELATIRLCDVSLRVMRALIGKK